MDFSARIWMIFNCFDIPGLICFYTGVITSVFYCLKAVKTQSFCLCFSVCEIWPGQ